MINVKWLITSWISLFFLLNFLFILAISFSLSRISSFVSNILFFYRFSSWCSLEVALNRKAFRSANQREVSKWKRALTIVRSFDNPSARSWISWIDFSWLSSFFSYSFCSLFKSTKDLKYIDRWRTLVQFWKTPREKGFPLTTGALHSRKLSGSGGGSLRIVQTCGILTD